MILRMSVLCISLPTDNFVKLARPKRNIKAKHFKDHITSNIVEKRTCNNIKGLELSDYFLRAVLNASKEFACTTLFGRWFQ
jgi:hypothetical protein